MPRKPHNAEVYDEYDARAYRHLVEQDRGSVPKKKKKPKQKRKRQKDPERVSNRNSSSVSSDTAVRGKPNLVDYDDVSSDSDISNGAAPASPPAPSRMATNSRDRGGREPSPATALRTYMSERSHSNSPRDPSPYSHGGYSSRKKKRHASPELPVKEYAKSYGPPKAYADPPKAYVDPPKAYSGSYRGHSPSDSPRKRYRSRSPSPQHSRKKNR